jgi:hypothetical protein
MKDDDQRPKAPEGYTVMLGKDFTTDDVPIGTKAWTGARWSGGFLERQEASQMLPDMWYAVPITTPNTDPKASQAVQKPQLQLIPPALNDETAKALSRGAVKYGPWNWRENKVELMTYLGAMKRHIDCLIEGEDIDPDTGAHHLGCVAAGCGIVLDARKHGTLVDNRPSKVQNT